MAAILCVTPNPLLDHLARASFAPGAITRVERFVPIAGGKGVNAGRVLARHGHRVVATGFAGGATGAQLRALVAADGMEPGFVETAARLRIGFQAVEPAGHATALLENGFAVEPEEQEDLLEEIALRLPEVDLVLVGGSVPDPGCTELLVRVLGLCARAGRPCWVDSYGPAMERALACAHPPALAKPNRAEHGDGRAFARCPEVHITDGPRPVQVRRGSERWVVTPPRVDEVLQTGSGDCYLAALAHARLSGSPFDEQLRYASAAGAANALRADVAGIGPADIEPLAAAASVERAI